ncbi:MAG: homocysteine S-methyltransferase family protein [Bacteroidales bacterium]
MGVLINRLKANGTLVSDGAWGTFLHQMGLSVGECPELWNLERPGDVLKIARSYVEAGADLILTNSFGGHPAKLEAFGLKDKALEINRSAAEISREAAGEKVLVLGSMGPTGKMILTGEITEEVMEEGFRIQARGLAEGGADVLLIETMSDLQEAALAIRAAKSCSSLEVACTFTFSRTQTGEYRTMMGTGVEEYLQMVREEGVDVVGANCGNGTAGMVEIVREIRAVDQDIPVLVHANAGLPVYRDGQTIFPESPEEMSGQIGELVEAGANIVGGCCGTTPEHIRMLCRNIKGI